MKKFTVLFALILMTVAVAGCPSPVVPVDPTTPVVEQRPTPVIHPPVTPVRPTPVIHPPITPVPTEAPVPVPVASWWPRRPAGVPVNFVYCPLPSPSGGGPEIDWRLLSACTYDPYIQR